MLYMTAIVKERKQERREKKIKPFVRSIFAVPLLQQSQETSLPTEDKVVSDIDSAEHRSPSALSNFAR
jgi:hypothetical protein